MKKLYAVVICLLLLCGCADSEQGIDRAMKLRTEMLHAPVCSFVAEVMADFDDKTYRFTLECEVNQNGDLTFCVLGPEYIAGISGIIDSNGGKLTFDNVALGFALENNDIISPVTGPWIFVKALREGYIRNYAIENDLLRLSINDSYKDDAFMLDIWLDFNGKPIHADIYEENYRILTISVKNFSLS
jgi:hypothetical protein